MPADGFANSIFPYCSVGPPAPKIFTWYCVASKAFVVAGPPKSPFL